MKALFSFLLLVGLFYGCYTSKGAITALDLNKGRNKSWFNYEYQNYVIDTNTLNEIPESFNNKNYSVEIFMGTWCSDSQRETPRIIKIFKYLKFTNYQIFALEVNKKSEEGFETDKNILKVPTIILYNKEGKEVNRIIEYPVASLESDLKAILKHNKYTPNYSD